MAEPAKILKLRVSLKGRPLRTYSFGKEVVTVGRSADCDVFLDNPGISRGHLRLVRGTGGHYQAEDLGSANGTFLNEEPLSKEYLMHDDVLRIGKFSMWVAYEEDRRGEEDPSAPQPEVTGTTVLSTDELTRMMQGARTQEDRMVHEGRSMRPQAAAPGARSARFWMTWLAVSFVAGTVFGAACFKLLAG